MAFPTPSNVTTLPLHDALPISIVFDGFSHTFEWDGASWIQYTIGGSPPPARSTFAIAYDSNRDRAARRRRSEEHTSESSHGSISYAVFCLKKKKKKKQENKDSQ